MKFIFKAIVLFILIMSFKSTKAQVVAERRPTLFSAFANTLSFSTTELEKIFTTPQGSSIKLNFAGNVNFTGTITSSIQKFDNLQSVIIKLDNLDGTILGISKRTDTDNSITYIGRIINVKYADAYQLKKDKSGNYSMNKVNTHDLIQDTE